MMDPHPDSSTSVSERASHPAEAGESAAAADSPGPERLAALVDLGRKLAEARQARASPCRYLPSRITSPPIGSMPWNAEITPGSRSGST